MTYYGIPSKGCEQCRSRKVKVRCPSAPAKLEMSGNCVEARRENTDQRRHSATGSGLAVGGVFGLAAAVRDIANWPQSYSGMRTTELRDGLPRSAGAAEKTRPARPARVKLPMQILLTSPAKMPTPRRIDTSGASGAREFRSGAGASRRYPSCHHRGRDISLCQIQAAWPYNPWSRHGLGKAKPSVSSFSSFRGRRFQCTSPRGMVCHPL